MTTMHTESPLQNRPEPPPTEPELLPARAGPSSGPVLAGDRRVRAAWVVAVLVDALQLATGPAELTGPLAWFVETGADLVTALVMIWLLGFHWVFLPSFITKMLPFVDLAPTWTMAMFFVARGRRKAAGPKEVE